MAADKLNLRVHSITYQAEGINAFEMVDPSGGRLPEFSAGSHIDIFLPGGVIRQYSLCNDPAERHRYVIAVQREQDGRGGSKAVHESVRAGRMVSISKPRNNFGLSVGAARHMFLAGGIGITPIMAMIRAARARGDAFKLHYCTRTPERTAFREELRPLVESGAAHLHHDQGDPAKGLDIGSLLREYEPGTHLYFCGPAVFMAGVETATRDWPRDALHSEYFSTPEAEPVSTERPGRDSGDDGFQVRIASTGAVFDVPDGTSIVEVLRRNGFEVETSCESGLCGTCRTRYLEGEPDHRDYILSDEEKAEDVLICCARALTPMLVLDL